STRTALRALARSSRGRRGRRWVLRPGIRHGGRGTTPTRRRAFAETRRWSPSPRVDSSSTPPGGLARLSSAEEAQLRALLRESQDGENLVSFYEGYDNKSFPDSIYVEHLEKLNAAFRDIEHRLQDGRSYLIGENLTMADIIWAMKTLRLIECDYPFDEIFPAYSAWFQRIEQRPSFQEGVMGKHKTMSRMMRAKAGVERLLGIGLKKEVLKRVA
ncbi:MAG: glutathione binding-like protein, partial [Pseudomonadota bacterium]